MDKDESKRRILLRASSLRGHTLAELFEDEAGNIIGGTHSKGTYGNLVERYFHLDNNNRKGPDFEDCGMELKVSPMVRREHGYSPKERMIISIINYEEVPDKGFRLFMNKGSDILIVFYHWSEGTSVNKYPCLKVVEWIPTDEEMRILREDWDVIEGYVKRGEAHLLSERLTKFLSACTKGQGGGNDMRKQPFSDIPAKQRALSFKPCFVKTIFDSRPDVGDVLISEGEWGSVFDDDWSDETTFEEHILFKMQKYVGMTCREIEQDIDYHPRTDSKQYYYSISTALLGAKGKKHVLELEEAGIVLKTVRMKSDESLKESMSFPKIDYNSIVEQDWEDSDLHEMLDRCFLFFVYEFAMGDTSDNRDELIFKGAFFWTISDDDMKIISEVWKDTRDKIAAEDFDHFVKISDRRISHVRPHGRDSNDVVDFRGKPRKKYSFWLNSSYVKKIISDNLYGSYSTKSDNCDFNDI